MIVLLGSTRPAKVDGTREALERIAALDPRFRDAALQCRDLGNSGPRMPMSEAEMIAGAERRVASLLAAGELPGGDEPGFAVGLEGGLDPIWLPDGTKSWALESWACVTDGRRWSYGAGGRVLLPHAVAEAVLAGEELGDVIDRVAGTAVRGTRGAWGVLTRDLWGRRDAFRLAVISAFAPFYNPVPYR